MLQTHSPGGRFLPTANHEPSATPVPIGQGVKPIVGVSREIQAIHDPAVIWFGTEVRSNNPWN
jgi:hypothetical protein